MTAIPPRVVCLSGSLAPDSRTERVVRWFAGRWTRQGGHCDLFTGDDLDFPFYRTEGPRPEPVTRYLDALSGADAVLLASPAYHCAVSGLLKNALDYVNDLRAAPQPFLDGRPVGCVAVSLGNQGGAAVLTSLRTVAHALRGWPTPLGVALSGDTEVAADGRQVPEQVGGQLEVMLAQMWRMAAPNARRRQRAADPVPVARG
ncbi:NADPH-dependent FMN reductase [Streptomyces sp. I05A-00742]|uniref:NADPH-dependent FMN reductase n=1 Tax=Streptomyces sp. I05A-00742 TaxID=2732853 RepID=UPI0014895A51|nr:NADPH-dependent FMN reductase [Streptomyces sp. I05A-00742]